MLDAVVPVLDHPVVLGHVRAEDAGAGEVVEEEGGEDGDWARRG